MVSSDRIEVEVAYATPEKQLILPVSVAEGATAIDAIKHSGINEHFPELDDADELKFGVFGKICKADRVLRGGDRVEIYRQLIADPKEVRKQRAAAGKAMKKGGGDAETA